jgi:uncharacterized protein YndB with AHSA1/START domain
MPNRSVVTAKSSLLIRRPAAEVFKAFVDARTLTQFWLSHASGSLELGKTVRWEFMVPGAGVDTRVTTLELHKRLAIEWSDHTSVEWRFEPCHDGTIVRIENWGFTDPDSTSHRAIA